MGANFLDLQTVDMEAYIRDHLKDSYQQARASALVSRSFIVNSSDGRIRCVLIYNLKTLLQKSLVWLSACW